MIKRKPGVLDIIIIVVILAAALGAAAVFTPKNEIQRSGRKTTIEFDVLAINLTEQETEGIKHQVGTNVIFGTTNSDTGLLKSVEIEPYLWLAKDTLNGEFVWTTHPTNFQAVLTIEKEVTQTDDIFKGEREEIRIGESMPFRGKGF